MKRDDGTVLVQAIAGVLLALVTAVTVFDVGNLFLTRTAVMSAAHDVALHAATAIDIDALYEQGIGDTLPLDPALAAIRAQQAVGFIEHPRVRDLRLDDVVVDGSEVRIVVSAHMPSPLRFGSDRRGLRIRAAAAAAVPTRW